VPDPYYGGDAGFDTVFSMVDEACEAIAKKLIS
jgi:protein-tyrosine phosphatase